MNPHTNIGTLTNSNDTFYYEMKSLTTKIINILDMKKMSFLHKPVMDLKPTKPL